MASGKCRFYKILWKFFGKNVATPVGISWKMLGKSWKMLGIPKESGFAEIQNLLRKLPEFLSHPLPFT